MILTHVLRPITIGEVGIKNRVVRTAHGTGHGAMSDTLIAYHAARARGGVGLTIIEVLCVHPSAPAILNAFDPDLWPRYAKLVDECRPHGMALFQQIWHAGHNLVPWDGSPPWSSSDVPGVTTGVTPVPMTKMMIDEVIAAYASAVRKCWEVGLNGAELHCAHGYLPAQFLSAAFNRRTDEYGGSLENRMRFALEMIRACRAEVPSDFAIGLRVAPDLVVGGVTADDNACLVEAAEAERLIDFVDVSLGNYQSFSKMIGGMHEPTGYEVPTSESIVRRTALPTIVTGRVRTLEEADQIIRNGSADMVGMTRAHIADPDIVRKTAAGHPEQVRPCIACNQGCIGNLQSAKFRVECAVNPGAGYEADIGDDHLEPSMSPCKVLVVGGGPAGMEAARVAAIRGHDVSLAEAQPNLGGALRLAAMAPTRHSLADILAWLEAEIYRLGVHVSLSSYMDADDIADSDADAVLIATGAMPRLDGRLMVLAGRAIDGAETHPPVSAREVFYAPSAFSPDRAVVYDEVGHYEGIAVAEHLASRGTDVTYITRHASFAPLVDVALMAEPALQRFARLEVEVIVGHTLQAVSGNSATIAPLPSGAGETRALETDLVVVVSPDQPLNELVGDGVTGKQVRRIGDALSPRFLQVAIREGHLAARAI